MWLLFDDMLGIADPETPLTGESIRMLVEGG